MSDWPEYIPAHAPGGKAVVLKRCAGNEMCYEEYVKTDDIFKARDLVGKLNMMAQDMFVRKVSKG